MSARERARSGDQATVLRRARRAVPPGVRSASGVPGGHNPHCVRSAVRRFKTPELARRALAVEIPEIKGKTMTAAPLRTAGFVDSKSRQLFLRGWPRHVTNEQVYARYAHLGPTAIAGIHWLPGRGMRSCCFLTFDSKDNRDKALAGGGFQFDDATVLYLRCFGTPLLGLRARLAEAVGRRLEEVAKAVGGGYRRLQMPLKPALGVRGTVARA